MEAGHPAFANGHAGQPGLTQRDYIAIAATQGMLSAAKVEGTNYANLVAFRAYKIADAMIMHSKTTPGSAEPDSN